MYAVCWLVVYLQSFLLWTVLSVLSVLGRASTMLPEKLTSFARQGGVMTLSVLAILSCFICGSLGVFIISFVLTLKVLGLLSVVDSGQDSRSTHKKLSLYFPLMMLVSLQAFLSLGPAVIWFKSLEVSSSPLTLPSDPSRLSSLVLTVAVAVLCRCDHARIERSPAAVLAWFIYIVTWVTLMFASRSMYRLPAIITSVVCGLSVVMGVGSMGVKEKEEENGKTQ